MGKRVDPVKPVVPRPSPGFVVPPVPAHASTPDLDGTSWLDRFRSLFPSLPAWDWRTVALIVMAVAFVWSHLGGATLPGWLKHSEGDSLGHAFRGSLCNAMADGHEAEANALEGGKKMEEAEAALKDAFSKGLNKAFERESAPAFARIVPEATEPDPATAKRYIQFDREYATGLRRSGWWR